MQVIFTLLTVSGIMGFQEILMPPAELTACLSDSVTLAISWDGRYPTRIHS
jgi:hypothetical protein